METLPKMLRRLREQRRISRRHLAETAGVAASLVTRAERGCDSRLSTWLRLFEALGYGLSFQEFELSEEAADVLADEAAERLERRDAGLCTDRRRW